MTYDLGSEMPTWRGWRALWSRNLRKSAPDRAADVCFSSGRFGFLDSKVQRGPPALAAMTAP